ncbi:MAG TPA: tetratricopeptide repeat protein [Vicinamibacterales bacterium]|nr:tetratricopeptide repeat protein [Vicinamibacterales bacterium]
MSVASRTLWIVAGLVVLTVAVFADVRTFDFVSYDDPWYITDNPNIASGLSWSGLRWAFTSGYLFYWHPATWLSHMADVQLFGLNAGGHHVTNLVLHVAGTLALFGFLRRATGAEGRSALVAALFAVHPLHVESVAWVAERKDVLSTLFLMLTMWAYVAYAERRTTKRYLIVVACFALGLMAKPMLVTLPALLILLDVWPLGGDWALKQRPSDVRNDPGPERSSGGFSSPRIAAAISLAPEKIPLFGLAAVVGVATFVVQSQVGAVGTLAQLPLSYRLANTLVSYVRYLWQMVWPSGLAVFYPYPPELPPWWQVLGAAAILIGVTIAAARSVDRRPYLLVGWLWYVIALLPVIGLFQAGDQLMADRFTYVPLVGLFIIVAWGAAELLARQPRLRLAGTIAAGVIVIAFAVAAQRQVQYWRNSETLWRRALAVTTGNHRAHAGLAEVFSRENKTDEAIAEYRQALRIVADQPEWRNNLGLLYVRQNKIFEAMGQFAIATRVRPGFVDAHNNLGAMHARAGQSSAAIAEYGEALRLAPDNALAHGNLARALAGEGRIVDAMRECQEAIRLDPGNDEWRRLATSLSQRSGK